MQNVHGHKGSPAMRSRVSTLLLLLVCAGAAGQEPSAESAESAAPAPRPTAPFAGLIGPVGAYKNAKVVRKLVINKAGVYENLIIDGQWGKGDLVRILADNVVLRNCTIRYGRQDAIEVYAKNVLIESCKIHHFLTGTFKKQHDCHGITGRPKNLTIRNCEIAYLTGDSVQFDPDRKQKPYPWDNVLVEHCFLWTGPLDRDYPGFKKGERPGENAFDSKVTISGWKSASRPRITIRNTIVQGWGHGQISTGAALNFKEKIQAVVDNCVLVENDVGFRCRGTRGSAWITARNCTAYTTSRVFRFEDKVENVKIFQMAYGSGVKKKFESVAGGRRRGAATEGTRQAPPLPAWPYDRLMLGRIVPFENHAVFSDDALPTKRATGWEPSGYRPSYLAGRTDGSGQSVAADLFGTLNNPAAAVASADRPRRKKSSGRLVPPPDRPKPRAKRKLDPELLAKARAELIARAMQGFHKEGRKPRKVFVNAFGKTTRAKLLKITASRFTAEVMGTEMPFDWETVEPKRIYGTLRHCLNPDSAPDHFLLARFCAAALLDEQAGEEVREVMRLDTQMAAKARALLAGK